MIKIDAAMLAGLPFELHAEISENLFRKDWTPSEIDTLRRRCEAVLRAQAKKNQAAAGPSSGRGVKRTGSGKFPEPVKGQVRDKIGAFAGVSGRTIEKIAAVVDAAEADPKRYGKLRDTMDRTGRIDGVFKRLRVAQQATLIRAEPPPLPHRGPYRVIAADPPWPFEIRLEDPSVRATTPYPQMSIAEIAALPVAEIAADDSILWLWTTNFHLFHGALDVLRAWRFEPISMLTWVKPHIGCGTLLRNQTEHCILATRGKPTVTLSNESTALHAPVREHSRKPDEFFLLVEQLCPAPRYCELFARRQRPNWDCHGDEVGAPAGTTEEAAS